MRISKQILLITPILFIIFAFGCSKSLLERDKLEPDSELSGLEGNLEGVEENLGKGEPSSGAGQEFGAAEQGMPGDGSAGSFSAEPLGEDSGKGDISSGLYEKPSPRDFGTAEQGMPGDGSSGSFSAEPFSGDRGQAGDGAPESAPGFFREENVGEKDAFSGLYEKPAPRDFGSAEQGMPGNGSTGSFSAEPLGEEGLLSGSGDKGKAPEPFVSEKGEAMAVPLPKDEEVRRMLPYHLSDRLQDIHFAFDRYDLTDKTKAILRENVAYLKSHLGSNIEIQGHCDERGSNSYNASLGQRRAQSTKSYLISQGIDENRLRTISYGEERPFCFESNEECWYQNRRAHFLVAE